MAIQNHNNNPLPIQPKGDPTDPTVNPSSTTPVQETISPSSKKANGVGNSLLNNNKIESKPDYLQKCLAQVEKKPKTTASEKIVGFFKNFRQNIGRMTTKVNDAEKQSFEDYTKCVNDFKKELSDLWETLEKAGLQNKKKKSSNPTNQSIAFGKMDLKEAQEKLEKFKNKFEFFSYSYKGAKKLKENHFFRFQDIHGQMTEVIKLTESMEKRVELMGELLQLEELMFNYDPAYAVKKSEIKNELQEHEQQLLSYDRPKFEVGRPQNKPPQHPILKKENGSEKKDSDDNCVKTNQDKIEVSIPQSPTPQNLNEEIDSDNNSLKSPENEKPENEQVSKESNDQVTQNKVISENHESPGKTWENFNAIVQQKQKIKALEKEKQVTLKYEPNLKHQYNRLESYFNYIQTERMLSVQNTVEEIQNDIKEFNKLAKLTNKKDEKINHKNISNFVFDKLDPYFYNIERLPNIFARIFNNKIDEMKKPEDIGYIAQKSEVRRKRKDYQNVLEKREVLQNKIIEGYKSISSDEIKYFNGEKLGFDGKKIESIARGAAFIEGYKLITKETDFLTQRMIAENTMEKIISCFKQDKTGREKELDPEKEGYLIANFIALRTIVEAEAKNIEGLKYDSKTIKSSVGQVLYLAEKSFPALRAKTLRILELYDKNSTTLKEPLQKELKEIPNIVNAPVKSTQQLQPEQKIQDQELKQAKDAMEQILSCFSNLNNDKSIFDYLKVNIFIENFQILHKNVEEKAKNTEGYKSENFSNDIEQIHYLVNKAYPSLMNEMNRILLYCKNDKYLQKLLKKNLNEMENIAKAPTDQVATNDQIPSLGKQSDIDNDQPERSDDDDNTENPPQLMSAFNMPKFSDFSRYQKQLAPAPGSSLKTGEFRKDQFQNHQSPRDLNLNDKINDPQLKNPNSTKTDHQSSTIANRSRRKTQGSKKLKSMRRSTAFNSTPTEGQKTKKTVVTSQPQGQDQTSTIQQQTADKTLIQTNSPPPAPHTPPIGSNVTPTPILPPLKTPLKTPESQNVNIPELKNVSSEIPPAFQAANPTAPLNLNLPKTKAPPLPTLTPYKPNPDNANKSPHKLTLDGKTSEELTEEVNNIKKNEENNSITKNS